MQKQISWGVILVGDFGDMIQELKVLYNIKNKKKNLGGGGAIFEPSGV